MPVSFNTLQPLMDDGVQFSKVSTTIIAICSVTEEMTITALSGVQIQIIPQGQWTDQLSVLARVPAIEVCAYGPVVEIQVRARVWLTPAQHRAAEPR